MFRPLGLHGLTLVDDAFPIYLNGLFLPNYLTALNQFIMLLLLEIIQTNLDVAELLV